ncbi:hypothetical protein AAC691_11570 [Nguyenibacter vanlangensis]|uniref:Acetyl-CoA carboxylase biotin carboxyl carrier protein n=1 Tax=Nguyenibacter vanlangensis TaxID=1216886 RepID=A0ABZ3D018_9PROT
MTLLDALPRLVAAMRRQDMRSLSLADGAETLTVRLAAPGTDAPQSEDAPEDAPEDAAVTEVPSPEMGVFRQGNVIAGAVTAGHAGDGAVGARVAAGMILGFVEIGPALLPIVAPRDGVVQAVLAADGAPIGYHAPAFAIRHE